MEATNQPEKTPSESDSEDVIKCTRKLIDSAKGWEVGRKLACEQALSGGEGGGSLLLSPAPTKPRELARRLDANLDGMLVAKISIRITSVLLLCLPINKN